jgi:DNA polymerase sigma
LAQRLLSDPWVASARGIDTASVPIVKLLANAELLDPKCKKQLKIDITFDWMTEQAN